MYIVQPTPLPTPYIIASKHPIPDPDLTSTHRRGPGNGTNQPRRITHLHSSNFPRRQRRPRSRPPFLPLSHTGAQLRLKTDGPADRFPLLRSSGRKRREKKAKSVAIMPQDMPPVGGYGDVQYKVRFLGFFSFFFLSVSGKRGANTVFGSAAAIGPRTKGHRAQT